MNVSLEFLPEAAAEFECIAGDYQSKQPGLGTRFRQQVEQSYRAIVGNALLWRERRGGYRRVNLPAFPYYTAYIIEPKKIIVAALAHTARQPDYWNQRLS